MASPVSSSPRLRRPVSPRPSPRYKFTIFPPDVYAPVTLSYAPRYDASYNFCGFLKGKFESHFGMRCHLPSEAGSAFIGDFDEFEQRFLADAEYIVVVVTEKSVIAMRKFYPRLLVFVTVRPEWVNRFIVVFVGNVVLDQTVDLSVLFHKPIIFKDSNWEADVETWKALHVLLKVEWTPFVEPRETLSVIERTVVETEVQEVRTRRRTSSRSSDSSASSGVERPQVVETPPSAGDRPRVRIERAPDTQVRLEPLPDVQRRLATAPDPPPVTVERQYEPRAPASGLVKIERQQEAAEAQVAPIRRPQLKERPPMERPVNEEESKKTAAEDLYLASLRRKEESRETSGYSSLDSSISARSLGAVQSPPLPPAVERREEPFALEKTISAEPLSEETKEEADSETNTTLETLDSVDAVQLNPSYDAAVLAALAQATAAVRRLVWAPVSDLTTRPFNATLLMVAATAASPIYRDLSMAAAHALASVLWPAGVTGDALAAGAAVVSLPVAEVAADATALVADVMPSPSTLLPSIVAPSSIARSSPSEVLPVSRFIFWVASPPPK